MRSIATSNAHYTLSSVGPCRPFVTSVTPTWSKHTVVSAALAGLFLAGAVTVDTSDLATAGAFAMLLVLVSFSGSPLMCPASNRLQECF